MRTLRGTLTFRFTLTMLVALIVIAGSLYLVARRTLHRQLDQSLYNLVGVELDTLTLVSGGALDSSHTTLEMFIDRVNRFVVRRSWQGHALAVNTPYAVDLPLDSQALADARAGEVHWRTAPWRGRAMRSVYAPGSGAAGVVQVAASLEPLAAVDRSLLLLLVGTVALGSAATLAGASWLGGSAARPIDDIVDQAREIEPGTSGQRIVAQTDVAECAVLVNVLNDLLERLDRAFAAQRRMIGDAGHDLRTPITAMRGEIEVALRGRRTSEEYRTVLHSALEELDRLHHLSDALITLARIEGGESRPQLRQADVASLLRNAVHRAAARGDGWHFRFALENHGPVQADIDPAMIEHLFNHLLDNAMQHTPPGTEVRVTLGGTADEVRVSVEDDGPGLPEDTLRHLFDRFFRGDAARSRSTGSGLGLTVSAAIAAAHGGGIQAKRGSRGGLNITVTLPRRSVTPAANAT